MPVTIKVKDVMDTKVVSLDSSATVMDAIKAMIQHGIWSLIVQSKGNPEGVVTERDIVRRCFAKELAPSKTTLGSIASSPLITIGPDASMREAMDLMASKDIRRLFVVDKGKMIGRITQTELFQSALSVMETLQSLSGVP